MESIDKADQKRYKTEILLKSKRFKKYQIDFLKALLTEPEYTLKEAEQIVETFFGKEGEE